MILIHSSWFLRVADDVIDNIVGISITKDADVVSLNYVSSSSIVLYFAMSSY